MSSINLSVFLISLEENMVKVDVEEVVEEVEDDRMKR